MAARKSYNPMPKWQGVFELWTQRYVNKNYWRVAHQWGSPEDAMQECAVVFARCLDRYRHKVNNHAWFMSLYKISVINEFNTASVYNGRNAALISYSLDELLGDEDGGSTYQEHRAADDLSSTNWASLSTHLSEIGGDLLQVLSTIIDMPHDAVSALFKGGSTQVVKRFRRSSANIDDDFMIEFVNRFIKMRLAESAGRRGLADHVLRYKLHSVAEELRLIVDAELQKIMLS